jgi:hypothetical protein
VTREQLAHILRPAAQITRVSDVVVIGSQSILGTYAEDQLPAQAVASLEADLAFFDDDDNARRRCQFTGATYFTGRRLGRETRLGDHRAVSSGGNPAISAWPWALTGSKTTPNRWVSSARNAAW